MRVPWNRGGLRHYVLLLGLLANRATPASIAAGIPLLLGAIGLQLWAKGCLHPNQEVTSAGPYRFVRHPFYLGNAFLDLGLAIMSGWWVLIAIFPVWWLAIYLPTMRREESEMADLFGDAYTAYRKRVPFLIPHRRPLPPQAGGFSWRNPTVFRTEMPRALRFSVLPSDVRARVSLPFPRLRPVSRSYPVRRARRCRLSLSSPRGTRASPPFQARSMGCAVAAVAAMSLSAAASRASRASRGVHPPARAG